MSDESIGQKCEWIRAEIQRRAAKDREEIAHMIGPDAQVRIDVIPAGNSGRVIARIEFEADADRMQKSLEDV